MKNEVTFDVPEISPFPGKTKSTVWKDFGFLRDEYGQIDKSNAVCKICYARVKYCGNTTNLHTHLSKHKRNMRLNSDNHESSSDQSFTLDANLVIANVEGETKHYGDDEYFSMQNGGSINVPVAQQQQPFPTVQTLLMNSGHVDFLNTSLAEYLISGLYALTTVDDAAFCGMLRAADAGYSVPSSRYFYDTLIPQMYDDTKVKVVSLLRNSNAVSVSIDRWTSDVCHDSKFISLFAHIVDDSWKENAYMLSSVNINGCYDASTLSSKLDDALTSWKLPQSVVFVTDNSKLMTSACSNLRYDNVTCLGTVISAAVESVVQSSEVEVIVTQCRTLITAFKRNPVDMILLKKSVMDANEGKIKPVGFDLDNDRHWTSTLDMMSVINKQGDLVLAIMQQVSKETRDCIMSKNAFEQLKVIVDVLKPLQIAANILSEQLPSTASMILPVLRKLSVSLVVDNDMPSDNIESVMKTKLWKEISSVYTNEMMRDRLLVASILDPRYKDLVFVEAQERKRARDILAEEANMLYQSTKQDNTTKREQRERSAEVIIDDEPTMKKQKVDEDDWLSDVLFVKTETKKDSELLEETVLAEIERYMTAEQTKASPFQWWKMRQSVYPVLSNLVKKYLCITATSEEFQTTYRPTMQQKTWTQQRGMLLPTDIVDSMVFLNKNYFKLKTCTTATEPSFTVKHEPNVHI